VRNKHAAAQSVKLAEEASMRSPADSQPRHWDKDTVEKFIRALFVVGTHSNVEITREMKTKKTGHNVKGYKLRFLRDHPNWRKEFAHLSGKSPSPPVIVSDEETEESPPREPSREPPKESEAPATPEDHSITVTTTPAEEPPISEVEEEPTAGTSVSVITIAYPLQSSLECPHCIARYSGEGLEDLRQHLGESHPEIHQDWTYLCALCANRKEEEEDMIGHLLLEHLDELRALPPTGVFQARERLLGSAADTPATPPDCPKPPEEPTPSIEEEVSTPPMEDEEEVPPLPPPLDLHPPLPPKEPPMTPPPLPRGPPHQRREQKEDEMKTDGRRRGKNGQGKRRKLGKPCQNSVKSTRRS